MADQPKSSNISNNNAEEEDEDHQQQQQQQPQPNDSLLPLPLGDVPSCSSTSSSSFSHSLLRTHSLSPSHSLQRPRWMAKSTRAAGGNRYRPRSITATSSASITTLNWPNGSSHGTTNGVGGNGTTGGLMAILQRAFCNGIQQNRAGQYKTVLTRESPDSGLELDRMENGEKRRSAAGESAEGENEEKEKPKAKDDEDGEDEEGGDQQEGEESKKKPRPTSFDRLLSFLSVSRPSLSGSTMFDFPSPSPLLGPTSLLDPNGYSAHSPIAQLSRANGALMAENQQMANRVEELEHSLRDHVAHLNSIYFTLHQRHGFDALQLPDGELVHLSQFKGPEVVLLTFVHNQSPPPPLAQDANGMANANSPSLANHQSSASPHNHPESANARRHRLVQQQIRHKQPPPSAQLNGTTTAATMNGTTAVGNSNHHSPSISGGSSCSVVSAGSADSASMDPVEMFHQLCIRPKGGAPEMAKDDREQIQAYVEWLKSSGGGGDEGQQNGHGQRNGDGQAMMAKFRAQQIQAQILQATQNGHAVHLTAESNGLAGQKSNKLILMNGWRRSAPSSEGEKQQPNLSAQLSEPAGGTRSVSSSPRVVQQQQQRITMPTMTTAPNTTTTTSSASSSAPPTAASANGQSKSQRIRTHQQFPSTTYLQTRRMTGGSYGSALISGNHHTGERSPRRGGIGLVSACRSTMRTIDHRAGSIGRNLI